MFYVELECDRFLFLLLCLFGVGANENYSFYKQQQNNFKKKNPKEKYFGIFFTFSSFLSFYLFIFPVAVVEEKYFQFCRCCHSNK